MSLSYGDKFWIVDDAGGRSEVFFSGSAGRMRRFPHGIFGTVECCAGSWVGGGSTKIHLCASRPCPALRDLTSYDCKRDTPPIHVQRCDPPAASSSSSSSFSSSSSRSSSSSTPPGPLDESAVVAATGSHEVVGGDPDDRISFDDASMWSIAASRAPSPTSGPAPEPPLAAIGVSETPTAPALGLRATSEDVLAIAEHCFRKPFAFVGLLAPAVLAAMCKLRVRVAIDTVLLDPVEEFTPGIDSGVVAPAAEPITFAFVDVRSTGVNA